jgi:hypothetical protein
MATAAEHGLGSSSETVLEELSIWMRDEGIGPVKRTKKRHVEFLTRLPTKRMATACWAFIVAKRPDPKTAPLLDFGPLHVANSENYPQFMHKHLWAAWG